MEEKSNIFGILCFIISRKVKTQLKPRKRFVQCMEEVLCLIECQKWFVKFCAGDFLLHNAPWSGRPVKVDNEQIETLIENNQCYTPQEIADILKISKSSVENHLHYLGYVNRCDGWVPHKLREKYVLDGISTCSSLLKCNENIHFKNTL